MKRYYQVAHLLILLLLFNSPQLRTVQAQIQQEIDPNTTPDEKVDKLFTSWDSNKTPGVAVAIVKDGAIVYKNGYGMANLEYDIPITPATIFHIASVSKQFTVFSILLLESEGKLSLDDDIRKYIPEVPDFGKTITLRHLASHTSGLRDQWALLAMAGWRLDDVITREHILKLVSQQKDLNFAPGDKYLYCNTGFTLLAEVVSRVSGQSFAAYTEANIFEPLQMNHTLFYDDHEKIVKNRAYSYYGVGTGFKKSVLSFANVGATSLFTTVEDLSLWTLNFSEIKIGNAEILKTMNTPAVLNSGEEFGGALGQFAGKYKGLYEIHHDGADAGYRSYLGRFPDQNFSIIVFSNTAYFNAEWMAHRVVDIYLKDQQIIEDKVDEQDPERANEKVVDGDILNSYVGEYELRPGFTIRVTKENDQLFGKATGQANIRLIPITSTEFVVEGLDIQLEFVPGDAEKVDSVRVHQGGQISEGLRLPPFDKSDVNLQEYSGRFYSEELSTEYIFQIQEGKLIARHIRLSDIKLTPTRKDLFSGDAWFFSQIEFIRGDDNGIIGCQVSSDRVINLKFKKMISCTNSFKLYARFLIICENYKCSSLILKGQPVNCWAPFSST